MYNSESIVYFDNNATTKVDSRVLAAMIPFLAEEYANPHSAHYFGNEINKAIEKARAQVASIIGAYREEITFTSGSTEAINIAIKGISDLYGHKSKHIITVATEHHAVLDTCKFLEGKGFEITYLGVNDSGLIDLDELKASLRSDTILVCLMFANNETGIIQPIKEVASIVKKTGALFFTDATQAIGKIDINVYDFGIDILCLSGHKIYGPKGVGALYIKNGINLPTYTHGGGQEKGLRSGTLNVPGIVALGVACEICNNEMHDDAHRIGQLRDKLEGGLLRIPETYVNGDRGHRVYNVTNMCFKGIDASVLIGRLRDIAVSNGSACTSAVEEPSHVLIAMGLSEGDANASIRFSLGRFNTESEVDIAIKRFSEIMLTKLRYA